MICTFARTGLAQVDGLLEDLVGQGLGQFAKAEGIEPLGLVPGADKVLQVVIHFAGAV